MTMMRTPFRPVAAVGLVAAALIYVGSGRTGETGGRVALAAPPAAPDPAGQAPQAKAKANVAKPADKDPLRLFADWMAKPPAGVLIISGEQDGYLQPCGCTQGQLGGLGRRYD